MRRNPAIFRSTPSHGLLQNIAEHRRISRNRNIRFRVAAWVRPSIPPRSQRKVSRGFEVCLKPQAAPRAEGPSGRPGASTLSALEAGRVLGVNGAPAASGSFKRFGLGHGRCTAVLWLLRAWPMHCRVVAIAGFVCGRANGALAERLLTATKCANGGTGGSTRSGARGAGVIG